MSIEQLIILLPCYSLEDLQLSRSDEEAEELLSGWCGLFHPALLLQAESLPRWERAYDPPSSPDQALVVIPECSEKCLPSTWLADLPPGHALVVRRYKNLEGFLAALQDAKAMPSEPVDSEIVAEFVALGYAYLQVELMTRQLRYMSNLDEIRFRDAVVKAAAAVFQGDSDQVTSNIQRGYDLLTESREYFYPVQSYLLDLTLTAETTLGPALCREVEAWSNSNLLTTGKLLRTMAEKYPNTFAAMKTAFEQGKVNIVGGQFQESPAGLLPQPALIRQFYRGAAVWQELLGVHPQIFGNRRFGLSAILPGILAGFRYEAALHFALDDGRFPTSNQSKIRWEGLDGAVVDAVGRVPVDASRASTFLKLGETVGRALDLDQAAAIIFAHWPGQVSPWYHALRRAGRCCPVLGRFVPMTEYLRNTQYVGSRVQYKADEYRSAYLSQAVAESRVDPIGRWMRYVRLWSAAESLMNLSLMRALISGIWDSICRELWAEAEELLNSAEDKIDTREGFSQVASSSKTTAHGGDVRLDSLAGRGSPEQPSETESADEAGSQDVPVETGSPEAAGDYAVSTEKDSLGTIAKQESPVELPESAQTDPLLARVKELLDRGTRSLAELLPTDESSGQARGTLWVNPMSFLRFARHESELLAVSVKQHIASGMQKTATTVPTFGYSWQDPSAETRQTDEARPTVRRFSWLAQLWKPKRQPEGEEDILLEGETFQLRVDRTTGGIQGIYPLPYGRNLLGQRLGFRFPYSQTAGESEAEPESYYSRTIAEQIERRVAESGTQQVASRGRLVDVAGELIARFEQKITVWPHLPYARLDIHLEPHRMPDANPWTSYYACRFAWGDETMALQRSVGYATAESELPRLESLYFVGLEGGSHRLALLSPGIPYHRMEGIRKLDTLLIVRGETTRDFTLGIGVDLRYSLQAAMQLVQPFLTVDNVPPPRPRSAWLLTLDVRNVMVSGIVPILDGDRLVGLRTSLTETEGRAGDVSLAVCRNIKTAHRTDAFGEILEPLTVKEDRVLLGVGRFQTAFVELRF